MFDTLTRHYQCITLFLVILTALSGCANVEKTHPMLENRSDSLTTSRCLAVLPTTVLDNTLPGKASKSLDSGRQQLDKIIKEQFTAHNNVRFISQSRLAQITSSSHRTRQGVAVAQQLDCDQLLESTLHRFQEREGSAQAALRPASVSFSYRLLSVSPTRVICSGDFDETQKALSSNLFSLSKAQQRGFSWLTGNALLQEGLSQKFSTCQPLHE